ncbi:GNAT family N-acetyltransferase [Paenibacillus thalictri]|nr:GNAT family N-acetyltransferase [Paenibacillus thalictri]
MEEHEYDFFMDMQYESIYILQNKPPKDELLNASNIKKYNEGWGRKGDKVFIALKENHPVGAVWYRLFDENNQGYGFVDDHTPELGIAVLPEYRAQGIGRILMDAAIHQAQLDGYKALSLSVDPENAGALRLYNHLGFKYYGVSGTSWTMKLDFSK